MSLSNEIRYVLLDFVLRAIEGMNREEDDYFIAARVGIEHVAYFSKGINKSILDRLSFL